VLHRGGELRRVLTSPHSLPLFVSAPVLAMALWWVCLALGYRALRFLRVPLAPFSLCEQGTICTAVGAGLLQYEPYLIAAFGKLSPQSVLFAFGLTSCLVAADLLRVGRALVRALKGDLFKRPIASQQMIWLLLFAILMGILLLRSLTLSAFGSDDDGYHIAAPRRWLTDGFLSYLPTYTNTNASLGFEMLYVFGLATGNLGLKIIHFSAGIFTLLTLWLCGRRLGSGHAGLITISLLLIVTPFCNLPYLFGVAFVDFGACWMTLISVLVWLVWREQPSAPGWRLLVLMALVTGFAGSFKSTALTVAFAWTPVLVGEARRRGLGWGSIFATAVGLGAVAFLPVSPWLYRSWHLTGNPVYPMLSSLIPTRDWNPEMAAVFSKFFHYFSWAPATQLSESSRKALVGIAALLVLVSGGTMVARMKDPIFRGLVGFSTVAVLISLVVAGMVFRYWLAAEMCALLVLATMFVRRFRTNAVAIWLPSVLLLVAIVVERQEPMSNLATDFRTATGMTTLDQEYATDPAWNMWRYINEHTSSDARVLAGSFYTTFGASNYGCLWLDVRCFTTDSYAQTFINLKDWRSFVDSLNKAGIQYLLVSDRQFVPGRIGFSFTAEKNEYPFSRRLADQHGKKLAQFGYMQFYSVDPVSDSP
jgi:hypothetical protein